ncbi:MAG: FHA domain-containing protein [Polyangiales bacterium]
MARELECSIDYLVNEAMKQYARQRSYGGAQSQPTSRTPFPGARDTAPEPPPPAARAPLPPTAPAVPMARAPQQAAPTPPPPIPAGGGGRLPPPPPPPPAGRGAPLPPPPAGRQTGPAVPPPISRAPMGPQGGPPPLPRQPASMPPQQPPQMPPQQQMAPPHLQQMNVQAPLPPQQFLGALTAVYQGERTSVNKEKFIIGRGRQTSDLTIKDPNVSRQHAMIEFQNGVYYMVDLGSTNGVEYQGQRVTRKAIMEGDVFRICDHEVVFTYR